MPLTEFMPFIRGIQYDGTNSAEIVSLVPPYNGEGPPRSPSITSEAAGVLTLEMTTPNLGTVTLVIATGDWVTMPPQNGGTGFTEVRTWTVGNELEYVYVPAGTGGITADDLLADEDFINALLAEVPDPDLPVLHYQVGRAALPALLLNGTTSPVVTFDAAMPDTSYEVRWRAVAGASVLSMIQANGAVTKATNQVTIPLRAVGLASVAGVLLVEVYKLAAS